MNIEEDIIHRLESFIKELKQDRITVFRITAESREVLANDIENILADRERLEKENEEYKRQLDLDYVEENYIKKVDAEKAIKEARETIAKANKYDALVENVKNEVKELEVPILIYGGRGNGRTYAKAEKEAKKYILKHILKLLEEEEK